jgi:hypothetical protein
VITWNAVNCSSIPLRNLRDRISMVSSWYTFQLTPASVSASGYVCHE